MTDHSALLNLAKQVDTMAWPTVTNLCTDPQPLDPLNWYGGDNGLVLDSTHSEAGAYVQKNSAYVSSLGEFALPGNSFIIDPVQSYFGTAVATFRVTSDLIVSFRGRTSAEDLLISSNCSAYDASGTHLGFFQLDPGGTQTIEANTSFTWTGRLDFATLQSDFPDVDSVVLLFEYILPIAATNLPWFGSAMVVDAAEYPAGTVIPYRDGSSSGWGTNGDGTSTGPVDLSTPVQWLDIANKPTRFDPDAHEHVAADVTDLATVVKAYTLDEFADPVADVSMNTHKITDLVDGTNPQDATSLSQVEDLVGGVTPGGAIDTTVATLVADASPSDTRAALDLLYGTSTPPNEATKALAVASPNSDGSITTVGIVLAGVGGSSVPTVEAVPTSTSMHTATKRVDLLRTSAAVSNLVGMRSNRKWLWRGNAAGLGGFKLQTRFGPATGQTIASRLFVGLDDDVSAGSDVEPSTLVNMIGVGYDAADTDLYVMHNDASGAATKVATGLGRSSTDRAKVYLLTIQCAANGSSVDVTVEDQSAATSFTTNLTTNLPASTTFLAPKWKAGTGAVSSVIGIAFMGFYVEGNH